ncbi:uncharacterized protein VICG_00752 [Vittaforma corneae ATCC 50505]|uniref:Uncharacterized protein n=1 Tax=Vittaforma corneae (strain ATCC 50505) TaxID=993615 RepID=L2GMR9_VITCO|nr:uncharacterized protein VICG_00752 [Vittaforma corneae ATCC 50505]ELA42111.1 hypothetical protein VICG_00752 [Vittaforma corneae ATCC 50505]
MESDHYTIQFRKPAKRSELTLEQVLQSKNDLKNILNELLCIERFKERDIDLLDSYLIKNVKGRTLGDELLILLFEVYLKVVGFDLLFEQLAISNGLYEKHNSTICSRDAVHGCSDDKWIKYEDKIINKSGFICERARTVLSERQDCSKLSILAYIACLSISELYEGEYEVYYILDYILKERIKTVEVGSNTIHCSASTRCKDKSIKLRDGVKVEHANCKINKEDGCNGISTQCKGNMHSIIDDISKINAKSSNYPQVCYHSQGEVQTQRGKVAIGWAKYCKYTFKGVLFGLNCESFFEIEMLYLNDIRSLISVITVKKSHKLLYERLDFILKNKSYFKFNSLLANSHSNNTGSVFYTEKILLRVADENLTKQFIIQTQVPLKCFFKICTRMDFNFMKCMNLCIEYFEEVPDDVLSRVIASERFRVETFQAFKKITKTIIDRKMELPLDKLLSIKEHYHSDGNAKNIHNGSLRFNNWKIEVIHRINYILDLASNQQLALDSIAPFLKKTVSWDHPEISLKLVFRIKSYKIFKMFINKLKAHDNGLKDGLTGNNTKRTKKNGIHYVLL